MSFTPRSLLARAALLIAASALPAVAFAQRATLVDQKVSSIGPTIATADSTSTVRKATRKCGTAFRCKAGWDVAVLSVKAPAVLVENEPTFVRAMVTNTGSTKSPEVPAVTAVGDASTRWIVPALAPYDSAEVAVRITPTDLASAAAVTLDPDAVTGDKHRDNNEGETDVRVEARPTLEIGALRALTPTRPGGEIKLAITLRNTARAAALRDGSLKIGFSSIDGFSAKDATLRIQLPELKAQQELSGTIVIAGALDRTGGYRMTDPTHVVVGVEVAVPALDYALADEAASVSVVP